MERGGYVTAPFHKLAGFASVIFKCQEEDDNDEDPNPPHIIILTSSETHIHSSQSRLVKSFTAIAYVYCYLLVLGNPLV